MTHAPREALKPFAACVFNDNGDITIDTSHLRTADYVAAKKALRRDAPASSGVAKELADISTGQLFNALLSRINFDGMDPRTFSLSELKNAIDGAEWPR